MEVFKNAYFIVEVESGRRFVRMTRTSEPLKSLAELEQDMQMLSKVLKHLPRASYGLLLDLREARMRNDEAFETAIRQFSAALTEGWRVQATLVRTAVGSMQIKRQARESGNEAHVYLDEAEALKFVSTPLGN